FDYTIVVANAGPSAASSVTVTDALPASVTFVSASAGGELSGGNIIWTNLGGLAAGASTNLTLTVTAPLQGGLTNVASVGSPTGDPNPTNNGTTPPVVTVVTPVADLSVSKTASTATPLPGANFDYTIVVANAGPSAASSVTVTDALPVSVTFVSASAGGELSGGNVIWTNLGGLAAGASTNLTLTVTAPLQGGLTNVASVGSPTGDPNPTNNVTTPPVVTVVTPVADLSVSKTASTATPLPGANFDYTIVVANAGPSAASSVTVTDALPVNVTFVSASAGGELSGGNVIWTNLGGLAAGASTNLTLTVTAPLQGGLTNVASVGSPTGDPNPTNNVTTPPVVTVVTPVADLSVSKTASTATPLPGANFDYTIVVANAGPSAASSVTVTDALPASVTFVSASAGGELS